MTATLEAKIEQLAAVIDEMSNDPNVKATVQEIIDTDGDPSDVRAIPLPSERRN